MNKTEYLDQLQKYLKRLPKEDYDNAMEYFTEYFEEVGEDGEQKAIEELGTPKEAAAELLGHLLNDEKTSSVGRVLRITCLAVLAAPLGLPLALTAVSLILTGILMAVVVLLCMAVFSVSMVIVAVKVLIRGLIAFSVSAGGGMALVGMALFLTGAGILMMLLAGYLDRWFRQGVFRFSRWIAGKKGV